MLQGKQVILRAVEKEDVDTIKEWLADAELLHGLGARPIPLGNVDPEKLPEQFRLRDGRILAVVSKDKNMLGLIAFGNLHEQNRTASIMVLIGDRGEWNRGYGSDALRTAVRFAFEDLNLNCVEAHIPQFNTRGLRVFEKVGFAPEGTLRGRFFGRGKYWDVVVASALREGWTGEQSTQTSSASVPAPQTQQAQPWQPAPAPAGPTPPTYQQQPATPPPGSSADGMQGRQAEQQQQPAPPSWPPSGSTS